MVITTNSTPVSFAQASFGTRRIARNVSRCSVATASTAGFRKTKPVQTAFKSLKQVPFLEPLRQYSTKWGLVVMFVRRTMPTIKQHNTRLFAICLTRPVFCSAANKSCSRTGHRWRVTSWKYALCLNTSVKIANNQNTGTSPTTASKNFLEKSIFTAESYIDPNKKFLQLKLNLWALKTSSDLPK